MLAVLLFSLVPPLNYGDYIECTILKKHWTLPHHILINQDWNQFPVHDGESRLCFYHKGKAYGILQGSLSGIYPPILTEH